MSEREKAAKSAIAGIRKGQDIELLIKTAVSVAYVEGLNEAGSKTGSNSTDWITLTGQIRNVLFMMDHEINVENPPTADQMRLLRFAARAFNDLAETMK